ncbi:hypothetical protein GF342_05605 [Candidatus Woesearchaeota archaeon]|nr:hypothetical protein [Candidatus Woesearchaeota archaeon]
MSEEYTLAAVAEQTKGRLALRVQVDRVFDSLEVYQGLVALAYPLKGSDTSLVVKKPVWDEERSQYLRDSDGALRRGGEESAVPWSPFSLLTSLLEPGMEVTLVGPRDRREELEVLAKYLSPGSPLYGQ